MKSTSTRKPKQAAKRKRDKSAFKVMKVFDSFEAADQADREYSWSLTPAQRMRNAERLRQMNFGYGKYGNGKPYPRFEAIMRVVKMGES